jgi:hypothetical protein
VIRYSVKVKITYVVIHFSASFLSFFFDYSTFIHCCQYGDKTFL